MYVHYNYLLLHVINYERDYNHTEILWLCNVFYMSVLTEEITVEFILTANLEITYQPYMYVATYMSVIYFTSFCNAVK